jgi:hypothetical protein
MIYELPIFRQIRTDAALLPRDLQVWCAAIDYLDVVEPREMKHVLLERHFKDELDRSTIGRALNSLVQQGYLCRSDGEKGRAALYRVPLSRAHCPAESASLDETEPPMTQHVAMSSAVRVPRARTVSRGVF